MADLKVPVHQPFRATAPGEHVDITRGWRKWRELTWYRRGSEHPLRTNAFLILALGFAALPMMLVAPVLLVGIWLEVIVGGAVALHAAGESMEVALAFAVYTLVPLTYYLGEPHARFQRVYAGSGRIDVVRLGWCRSYTRDRYTLRRPSSGSWRLGVLELWGAGGRARRLVLTASDADLALRMWNLPEIAPPYGSGTDA